MSVPQPTPPDQTARLDRLVAESGIQLQLDPADSRLEELRCYQHWTLKDLDHLSGITEFSDIMCAVEWLQHTLQVELEALASSLYRYDLEDLTIVTLLLHVGVPADLLTGAESARTVGEYVQTALNAFRFQWEYQDDPVATGQLIKRLHTFADRKDIPLVEPDDLCEAAMSLRMVLLARGYPTVELGLTLRSETDIGAVPLGSLGERLTLRVKQTETSLRVVLWPPTGHNTVLDVPRGEGDYYIGGLDALQMQALETALRDRTQAILADSQETIETTILKQGLSVVWPTYLLPFQEYASLTEADKEQLHQRLQPLKTCLQAALSQALEDVWQQHGDTPLTLAAQSQQVIKDYLQDRLETTVYAHDRLEFLAYNVARLILQPPVDETEYQWTEAQNTAAKADGWLIDDVGHDDFPERDRYRLQAFDQSNRFGSDELAWLHVVTQSRVYSRNLHSQALAHLRVHAPQEHRLVWVSAYQLIVKAALQTPEAFRTWLRTLAPYEVIGWRLLEVFLQSLGVQRSQVIGTAVWLYYWDERNPIAVLGVDAQGQPLAEAPLPTWLVDFDQRLAALAKETETTPRAWTILHAAGGVLPA